MTNRTTRTIPSVSPVVRPDFRTSRLRLRAPRPQRASPAGRSGADGQAVLIGEHMVVAEDVPGFGVGGFGVRVTNQHDTQRAGEAIPGRLPTWTPGHPAEHRTVPELVVGRELPWVPHRLDVRRDTVHGRRDAVA